MLKKNEEGTGPRFHRVLCPWFGNHQERSVAVLFFFLAGGYLVTTWKSSAVFRMLLYKCQSLLLTFVFVEI